MENNEFVELFTSQASSYYSNGIHSQSECCHSYNGNNSEGSVLSQTEIESNDTACKFAERSLHRKAIRTLRR
jgi:hypothetical protein